jgi:predicted dehydrogenase
LGKIGMDYDYDDSSGGLIATHVKSLVLHPNFELVGAVDTDSDRRSRFNKKYNISAYERIEDLPKKSKIDLVVIATNTKDHFDSFIKIIENFNPRLILCEKPLSSNIQESRKMIDLAISANISLAVNYIRQYDPGIKRLIDIINDGGLGFPLKSCVWYRKGVYNNGSHMISLISRIFGRALDVDIITRGRMFDGWDPEPDFKIKFDKGEVVFLSGNEEDFSYNQMEIYGPKGKVLLDKDDNAFLWKVESDQVFGDYKVLELKPETIQTDMRRYQYNVLENISNFFINKSEIDCQGVGSLATMEILNLITEKLNEE